MKTLAVVLIGSLSMPDTSNNIQQMLVRGHNLVVVSPKSPIYNPKPCMTPKYHAKLVVNLS